MTFVLDILLYLASLKLLGMASRLVGRPAAGGWMENLILMKTQSSAQTWTWTLDFDLGFVNKKLFLSCSEASIFHRKF